METSNFVKNVISKDKNVFSNAILKLVKANDINDFQKMDEMSNFIFPFVKEKIINSFVKLVNEENLKNIFVLMNYYSYDFEDMIVNSLLKLANEDLTDILLEKFENGTKEQKAYCAKYFSKINDPLALPLLKQNVFDDFYYLKINSISALKAFNDYEAVETAKEIILKTDDEFKKLSAFETLIAYGNNINFVLDNVFDKKIAFKDNVILTLLDFNDFETIYENNKEKIPSIFNVLIDGYPETIDLSTVKYYEIIKYVKYLLSLNTNYSLGLLLFAKTKFDEFLNNDSYTYDLDKFTKDELKNIQNLLKEVKIDGFKIEFFEKRAYEFENTLNVIKEYNYGFEDLIKLLNDLKLPETYAISALEILKNNNLISKIDKKIQDSLNDDNLKAIARSYFN